MEARSTEVTVIQPQHGWRFPDLREIWSHRDLIYFMARRDIVARYRQAVVGAFWAILQPLLLAAVFAVFFGLLQKVAGPPGIPYPLFAVCGMVVWIPFAKALETGSASAVQSENLISKIYFPRAALPISTVIPPTVDFLLGFVVAVFLAMAYGFMPDLRLLIAPLAWMPAMVTALGVTLWLSALNVRYRDVGLLVPFITMVGLFIAPIIYPIDLIPDHLQQIYALNPIVGVLEVFRWAVIGTEWPGFLIIAIPGLISLVVLVTGALYFERAQRSFADHI